MKKLFPNWTYRCAARWLVIGGIVSLITGMALVAHAGFGTSPSACKPGQVCKPTRSAFVMTLAVPAPEPEVAPAAETQPEPADGLSTSPSEPALPANSTWLAQTALALVFGLQLLKKAVPRLFSGDGIGFVTALVASQLTVFTEALSRGESPSWALAKQAFVLGVLAAGGYTVAWRRGLKPLLQKGVVKVLGIPVPGWLA